MIIENAKRDIELGETTLCWRLGSVSVVSSPALPGEIFRMANNGEGRGPPSPPPGIGEPAAPWINNLHDSNGTIDTMGFYITTHWEHNPFAHDLHCVA